MCVCGLIYYLTIIISAHIFRICSVQDCLSQVKISETVDSLSGFWNCVAWKRQTNGVLFTPGFGFILAFQGAAIPWLFEVSRDGQYIAVLQEAALEVYFLS